MIRKFFKRRDIRKYFLLFLLIFGISYLYQLMTTEEFSPVYKHLDFEHKKSQEYLAKDWNVLHKETEGIKVETKGRESVLLLELPSRNTYIVKCYLNFEKADQKINLYLNENFIGSYNSRKFNQVEKFYVKFPDAYTKKGTNLLKFQNSDLSYPVILRQIKLKNYRAKWKWARVYILPGRFMHLLNAFYFNYIRLLKTLIFSLFISLMYILTINIMRLNKKSSFGIIFRFLITILMILILINLFSFLSPYKLILYLQFSSLVFIFILWLALVFILNIIKSSILFFRKKPDTRKATLISIRGKITLIKKVYFSTLAFLKVWIEKLNKILFNSKLAKFLTLTHFKVFLLLFIVTLFIFKSILFCPLDTGFGESTTWGAYTTGVIKEILLENKEFAMWDTHSGYGTPILWDPTYHSFHIFDYIFGFSTNHLNAAVRWQGYFYILMGAFAIYYLAIILGCRKEAGLLAGFAYILNYDMVIAVNSGYQNTILSLPWTALLVAGLWKSLFEKRSKFLLLSALSLAMFILSGRTYQVLFGVIIGAIMMIFYLSYKLANNPKKIKRDLLYVLLVAFLVYFLGFLLAAGKVVPIYEYQNSLSTRTRIPLEAAENITATFTILKDKFINFFHQMHKTGPADVIFLIFMLIAIFFRRDKKALFFTLLLFLMAWASLANKAPVDLYALFYYVIPGFKIQRVPGRFLDVLNFGMPVLVALGASYLFDLLKNKINKKTAIFVISFLVFMVVLDSGKFMYININNRDFGIFNNPPGIKLAALIENPTVEIKSGDIISLNLRLKNVGDLSWHKRTKSFLGDSFILFINKKAHQSIVILQDIRPYEVYSLRTVLIIPKSPGTYEIGVALKHDECTVFYPDKLFSVAIIERTSNEEIKIVHKKNINFDLKYINDRLIGNLPQFADKAINYNYMVSILSKLDGHNQSRVTTSVTQYFNSYNALLYDYNLTMQSNFVSNPKYDIYFGSDYSKNTATKAIKFLGMVNSRYLIARPGLKVDNLSPIIELDENIYIYENTNWQKPVYSTPYAILFIGQDNYDDDNSKKTKIIIYKDDFDPSKISIFNGPSPYVDDYDIEFLNKFDIVILNDYLMHDSNKAKSLLNQYGRGKNHTILELDYRVNRTVKYQDIILHKEITHSLLTEEPYIELTQESRRTLSKLLSRINNSPPKKKKPIVKINYYRPHEIKINLETFYKNTFLVFGQLFYPGWNAYLDGEKVPIYLANSIAKGVIVGEKGQHELIFKYQPVTFKIGIFLALVGICSCFWFYRKGEQFLRRFNLL